MKFASLKGGRDGHLIVVSRDLTRCVDASAVAPTLREAVENWDAAAPRLQEIANSLEANRIAHMPFDPKKCASPLPRSFGWADGSAYVNHVALVRKARGAEMPSAFWTDPLMYRGASDEFVGPCDDIRAADTAWGIDLEAEIAVVVSDVPQGTTPEKAAPLIRLLMLVNDVSLRNLIAAEIGKGFGFIQSKGQTAFSPVAVTPDELGTAFDGKKVHLPVLSEVNGKLFGRPNAGVDMTFDFPTLVSHAVKTRPLKAGAIVGSGTISNRDADEGPGKPIDQGGVGYSCIAEIRTVETILHGAPKTPYLNFGDRIRIEMKDPDGRSIFGAIEQQVVKA